MVEVALSEVAEPSGVGFMLRSGTTKSDADILGEGESMEEFPKRRFFERGVDDGSTVAIFDNGEDLAKVTAEDDGTTTEGEIIVADVTHDVVEVSEEPLTHHGGFVPDEEFRLTDEFGEGTAGANVICERGIVVGRNFVDRCFKFRVGGAAEFEEEGRNSGGRDGESNVAFAASVFEEGIKHKRFAGAAFGFQEVAF